MDDDPKTEILDATYQALCTHGYANLTLEDIAAESDRSKASIHYYFDRKRDLFAAFLGYLFEKYTDVVDGSTGDTARETLLALLDVLLTDGEDAPDTEFQTAMLEMKAQAPYDDGVRAWFTESDELLSDRIRAIIADGVESGELDERVDPDLSAEFLTTAIQGARTRRVAVGHSMDRIHEVTTRYVETQLVGRDASEVSH